MAKIKPESRVLRRSFYVGIGGIIVIAFLMYLTVNAQYGNPLSSKNYIKAVFHDVHALQGKDPVRQNSKGIGRVTDIKYVNGAAVVTLQIETGGNYHVYKDATAYIGDQSAVGAKFVGINPGHPEAGPLPDDTIPITQTKDSRDLYQVLNIFDPKTRASTVNFLRQVGGGMAGHADGFSQFMHSAAPDLNGLGTISSSLASKEANLPGLLDAADAISGHLRGREAQIASLIKQTDTTFQSISVDNGKQLGAILDKAPVALTKLQAATNALNGPLADTQVAMVDLQPGARGLGASNNDLRGTFREGVPVLNDTPRVAHQTAPALDDLTPMASDLRPLAPRLTEFFNRFAQPLEVLAPYSKEIGYLFVRGNSFVSEGTAPGVHYARLNASITPYTATGGFLKACHYQVNAYPKPGEADHDRLKLKNLPPCGIQARGLGSGH